MMNEKTKEQIDMDLSRIFNYADKFDELKSMCARCEEWCGEDHDYSDCLDKNCFTFFRCYAYLNFCNTFDFGIGG